MSANIKPYHVDTVISHHLMHPDEFGAWWLAVRFGRDVLLGIEDAPLVLWDAGAPPPDGRSIEEWEKHNLVLGTGLGLHDEHGLSREVRKGHCAATLLAKGLCLRGNPAIEHILTHLVANDRKGHRTKFDIASITWALYYDGATELEVKDILFEMFDATFKAKMREVNGELPFRLPDRPTLNDYIREWLVDRYTWRADTEETLKRARAAETALDAATILGIEKWDMVGDVLMLAERKHDAGAATPFDLQTQVGYLHAGQPESRVRDIVFRVLDAKRGEQILFMTAVDEVHPNKGDGTMFVQLWQPNSRPEPITISCKGSEREARIAEWTEKNHRLLNEICVVMSGNPKAHAAARSVFHPDIIVLRKPDRHVTIFFGSVPPKPCVWRIREEECKRSDTGVIPPREVLLRDGNIKEEPLWCYFEEGSMMLNGSLTAPGIPATRLSVEKIITAIVVGLKYLAGRPRLPERTKFKSSRR